MDRNALRLTADPGAAPAVELSISVKDAAQALSVDRSTIREMLRTGALRGHRAGAKDRAVRVYVESIAKYRESREIVPEGDTRVRRKPRRGPSVAAREADAFLRSIGCV